MAQRETVETPVPDSLSWRSVPAAISSKVREPLSLLRRRWQDLPVRWQLMISISSISIGAVLLSILLAVLDARSRVEVEVTSAMKLAQQLVTDVVKRMPPGAGMPELIAGMPDMLKYVRHSRIYATAADGTLVQMAPDESQDRRVFAHPERAPQWFSDLVAPQVGSREVRVAQGPSQIGSIVIVGEPRDELGEVWEEVTRRAVIWLGITAMMLVLLFVVLGRLLKPLGGLAGAMLELEDGHYGTRLASPSVRELGFIADRFNTLAEALEKARAENSRLYRNLIAVQEDERRQVANELHDEAGPCLFGITANVSSIGRLADQAQGPQSEPIKQRVGEIHTITERLKVINRDLLRRLRPVELGRIPLDELIGSLVAGFERRHPEVKFTAKYGELQRSYGEATDLTVFRCVQEALTNAIRHGEATEVNVDIREQQYRGEGEGEPTRKLCVLIHDNGAGFVPGASMGIGMTAMRERVRSIDGSSSIVSSPDNGTTISVYVPLRSARAASASNAEIEGIP